MKKIFTIIAICTSFQVFAQSIVMDDFTSGELSAKWQASFNTFQLSIENEALKIDYNRTVDSDQWDQFNYDTSAIDLHSYSFLIKLKSDVDFELVFKPIYTDGTDEWLSKNIMASSEFVEVELSSTSIQSRTLDHIYIYFDAGTTNANSGTVFFDYIKIDESVSTELLDEAIANAWKLYDHIDEGKNEGEVTSNVKAQYESDIQTAEATADEENLTVEAVRAAIKALNDATSIFEAAITNHPDIDDLDFSLPNLSYETKNFYANLMELGKTKVLFGMQDATGYGVGWSGDNDRSDVKDVCGAYPAIGAWSIKGVAKGNSYDDETYRMQKFFNLGGLNTVEWHMDSPYGGGFYWEDLPDEQKDKSIVASLLPGNENHEYFKTKLDNIIFYLRNLKGEHGQSIPVIFRPFHEHNGDWFWWGRSHCSIGDYVLMWQFVVDYFKENNVNNVVFAYSPDRFNTKANYLERYPGDEYVDILGFDDYWDLRQESGISAFEDQLSVLAIMAASKNKMAAVTETGNEGVQFDNWFTHFLLDPILSTDVTKRIAYAAVWRNANESHHYAPYPGHSVVPDFLEFYNAPQTIFMDNIPDVYSSYNYGDQVILSTKGNLLADDIIIYPVPSSEVVYIKSAVKVNSIEMYNQLGQVVLELNNGYSELKGMDVSYLKPGQYVLQIHTEKGNLISKQLIVN